MRPALLLWLAAPFVAFTAVRAATVATFDALPFEGIESDSGVEIRVEPLFNDVPLRGAWPVRLHIRNDSDRARSWDFTFSAYPNFYNKRISHTTTRSIRVDAWGASTVEIAIPLAPLSPDYTYPGVEIRAFGPGAPNAVFRRVGISPYRTGRSPTPFAVFSESLAAANWESLGSALNSASRDFTGARFRPTAAPTDVLAWSGVDTVWLRRDEWDAMDPAARQALVEWVKLGGWLHLCGSTGEDESRTVGFGRIKSVPVTGNDLDMSLGPTLLQASGMGLSEMLQSGYPNEWTLRKPLGAIEMNEPMILLFVGALAFVMGPVNLFVLHRRRRHMWVFVTTPAIALLASLLLAGLIVLQDGIGGKGRRANYIFTDPESHQVFILQEQASRTGLLMSRRVPVSFPHFIGEINLKSRRSGGDGTRRYATEAGARSGDWFVSRSVQAHLLTAVLPSRARVEIQPGAGDAAPQVISALGTDIRELFYCDERGRYWRAIGLRTGERHVMEPSDARQFNHFWTDAMQWAGPRAQGLLNLPVVPGHYYAAGEQANEHVIETLPSLKWEQAALLYFGPATGVGGPS